MTPQRKQRLIFAVFILVGVSMATGLIMIAVKQNVELYHTPTEVATGIAKTKYTFRMGGMVKVGSVKRHDNGITVEFGIKDLTHVVMVQYTGILPDLFREGQGIVAKGKLSEEGVFIAAEVLAKHDENYMPPEAFEAMQAKAKPSAI